MARRPQRDVLCGGHPGHPGRGGAAGRAGGPAAHPPRPGAGIPESRRYLVTTHDAFAYLAKAYDLTVAGFVTPNPAAEPSLADRRRLTDTIRNLRVPAVFLEPNLAARSATLTEVADEQGVRICPIYGDTLDDQVTSYVRLMRFNADSLLECLG